MLPTCILILGMMSIVSTMNAELRWHCRLRLQGQYVVLPLHIGFIYNALPCRETPDATHLNVVLETQQTDDHQLRAVTDRVHRRILHDEALQVRQDTLHRHAGWREALHMYRPTYVSTNVRSPFRGIRMIAAGLDCMLLFHFTNHGVRFVRNHLSSSFYHNKCRAAVIDCPLRSVFDFQHPLGYDQR